MADSVFLPSMPPGTLTQGSLCALPQVPSPCSISKGSPLSSRCTANPLTAHGPPRRSSQWYRIRSPSSISAAATAESDGGWSGRKIPAASVALAVATLSVAAAAWGLGVDQKTKRPSGEITVQVLSTSQKVEKSGGEGGDSHPLLEEDHRKALRSWRDRWQEGRIGFHMDVVNPLLLRFYPELVGPSEHDKSSNAGQPPIVLVPLSGKTVDLPWLAIHGNKVVGVELSGRAIEQLFDETRLPRTTAAITSSNKVSEKTASNKNQAFMTRLHTCGNMAVLEGDFFALSHVAAAACSAEGSKGATTDIGWWEMALGTRKSARPILGNKDANLMADPLNASRPSLVDAIWDRGSMVAIEPALRQMYASILASLLRPGGRILLVSVQFENGEGVGPPYNLPMSELVALFGPHGMEVKLLSSNDATARAAHLQKQGIKTITETVHLVQKKL